MQQNSEKFNSEFSALQQTIEAKLARIQTNECDNAKLLDESLEQFKSLKDLLDLNGSDLPQYVRKVSQEKINQLLQSINDAKSVIRPKKTFKFNAKKQQQAKWASGPSKALSARCEDQLDSELNLEPQTSFGLRDKSGEHLTLESEEANGKDIQICNLVNCVVAIHGNPSTVHIIDCKNSRISCGPVSTSVFIDKCSDSVFQLFCQQLRVHNTYDCTFHLHVCTRGIIEDSSRLKFGVYEFAYDQLESDILKSKLNRSINNWDKIEYFNWLVKNKQSPNWQLLSS